MARSSFRIRCTAATSKTTTVPTSAAASLRAGALSPSRCPHSLASHILLCSIVLAPQIQVPPPRKLSPMVSGQKAQSLSAPQALWSGLSLVCSKVCQLAGLKPMACSCGISGRTRVLSELEPSH